MRSISEFVSIDFWVCEDAARIHVTRNMKDHEGK